MKELSLHIGIAISGSSALSIRLLLIFDMHDPNVVLFLNVSFLSLLLASFVHVTLILAFTTIYASQ